MSNTDTSDEAAREYASAIYSFGRNKVMMSVGLIMWREAVHRCEARMEEERRKAFCSGYQAGNHRPYPLLTEAEAYRAFKEGQK